MDSFESNISLYGVAYILRFRNLSTPDFRFSSTQLFSHKIKFIRESFKFPCLLYTATYAFVVEIIVLIRQPLLFIFSVLLVLAQTRLH